MKQGYNAYRTVSVDTTDQSKLILITYDVAIKHARLALERFDDKKQIEERNRHILKVQDALSELQSSLNLEAGEIARNLFSLYDYMFRTTVEANIRNEKEKVEEVLGYLETLRSAWAEAAIKVKAESTGNVDLETVAVSG